MTSFTLNSTSTATRDLSSSEDAIIGQDGSLMILSGDAIDGTGSNEIIVAGSILATNGHGIDLNSAINSRIFLSSSATLISSFDGISCGLDSFSSTLTINNAGTIESGADGVDIRGTTGQGALSLINSGTVSGASGGLVIGEALSAQVVNSGIIQGLGTAISTNPGADMLVNITNTGTLIGGGGTAIFGGSHFHTIKNSGDIQGNIWLGAKDDVYLGRLGTVDGNILGQEGDDTIKGGAGAEYISGGDDDDLLVGRGGDDTVLGGTGTDEIHGGSGDDTLEGNKNADALYGGRGDDFVSGGSGTDTLTGGRGDDTLEGGGGADLFVFGPAMGDDRITDFEDGTDLIDLSAFNFNNYNELRNAEALIDLNGAVLIDLSQVGFAGTIIIDGIQKVDLNDGDFVF